MPSLGWYIRRVRAMSPAEVAWRVNMVNRKRRWRRLSRTGYSPAPAARVSLPDDPWPCEGVDDLPETADLIADANAVLNHEWRFFGLHGFREPHIDWHRDPVSGLSAPHTFGMDINHRDENHVGNIKNTWEKSRHHHLTVLASAYAVTRDQRFSREVRSQLLSWVEDNPYLVGVNWTHPLEQGIRLIAWVWIERLLRGSAEHEELFGRESPLWDSIYQHQSFIADTYSRGSSANNHLIGEMAGLFIGATAWPFFRTSAEWEDLARRELEHAMQAQTFDCGVNREMAFAYHLFTLEFFLLVAGEGRRVKRLFSHSFYDRLRAMLEVMPQMTDAGGNLPRYGDGDEGMALQLQPMHAPRDAWLYHLGRDLTGSASPVPHAGRLVASLLGSPVADEAEAPPTVGSVGWEDPGIYMLASERHTPHEVFVVADAGPHGFLSIAAHAHADALAFTLSAGGHPVFVDIGTFAYHTDAKWRDYFRGTRGHNTLTVDGEEQSIAVGSFLWTHQARTTVHQWEPREDGGKLVASHDGYRRTGVAHQRTLDLRGTELILTEELSGEGEHDLALAFHLHPACEPDEPKGNRVSIRTPHAIVSLTCPQNFVIHRARGEEECGWYSPEFGVKVPTWTLLAKGRYPFPAQLESVIEITWNDEATHES